MLGLMTKCMIIIILRNPYEQENMLGAVNKHMHCQALYSATPINITQNAYGIGVLDTDGKAEKLAEEVTLYCSSTG